MKHRSTIAHSAHAATAAAYSRLVWWLPPALALAALLAPGQARSAPGDSDERYTISGERVAVYNLAGAVVVEPTNGSQVVVEVTRGGDESDRLRIGTGTVDGRQSLRVIYPERRILYPPMGRGSNTSITVRENGTFGGNNPRLWPDGHRVTINGSGTGFDGYADLHVLVPKAKDVLLRLAVGDVRVTNVDSKLFFDLANGAVTTTDTRGDLGVDTGSGSVKVTRANGQISIDTGSGDVWVKDVHGGALSIDTGSGSVDVSAVEVPVLSVDTGSGSVDLAGVHAPSMHVDTGSGSVTAEILSVFEELAIDTGSGGVEVALPKEIGAMLTLETGSGDLDVDLPMKTMHRDHGELHGQVGDGRGRIVIETGSGGIRIAGH